MKIYGKVVYITICLIHAPFMPFDFFENQEYIFPNRPNIVV